jgi:hypothetical protein
VTPARFTAVALVATKQLLFFHGSPSSLQLLQVTLLPTLIRAAAAAVLASQEPETAQVPV